mgnify:CR=1 FL=1
MKELIQKALYSSVGMVFLTKEKMEETVKKLVNDANLSEDEGKKFFNEMVSKSKEAKGSMENTIRDIVRSTLTHLDMPTRDEMKTMERRISELEGKLKASQE